MNDIALQPATTSRAADVRHRIESLSSGLVTNFFDLAELLSEAKVNNYHTQWGYERFGDWVKTSSLDMSERQSYYLISIYEKSKVLGLTRDVLKGVKLSKLKEIFSLEPEQHAEKMKALVESGDALTLSDVRNEVRNVKAGSGELEKMAWITLKVPESARKEIDAAIEKCRKIAGDNFRDANSGEPVDISTGRAVELICANFNATEDFGEGALTGGTGGPVLDVQVVEVEVQ